MDAAANHERGATFEIALVLAIAVGAVTGAVFIATSLPLITLLVGAVALFAIGFVVLALLA